MSRAEEKNSRGRYPVLHREYAGGHDYLVWRGALADGLLALFESKDPKQ